MIQWARCRFLACGHPPRAGAASCRLRSLALIAQGAQARVRRLAQPAQAKLALAAALADPSASCIHRAPRVQGRRTARCGLAAPAAPRANSGVWWIRSRGFLSCACPLGAGGVCTFADAHTATASHSLDRQADRQGQVTAEARSGGEIDSAQARGALLAVAASLGEHRCEIGPIHGGIGFAARRWHPGSARCDGRPETSRQQRRWNGWGRPQPCLARNQALRIGVSEASGHRLLSGQIALYRATTATRA